MTPEQLLIVNVLADGIPGFFLSRELAEPGIMRLKPIPKKPVFLPVDLEKE